MEKSGLKAKKSIKECKSSQNKKPGLNVKKVRVSRVNEKYKKQQKAREKAEKVAKCQKAQNLYLEKQPKVDWVFLTMSSVQE